ncbi:hypothetical protein E1293_40905 [Actinomadura darangshiensis]|uniref:Alkaline shock response membrane anchor protein AmaP n=1 Tax=Actinomadura darangshiensis TaxID=705336 RepID=A0A4R5A0J6_9ACTN|nr:hypothetical protein [Actinomadura darangshiensis]TDD64915.1 hypothetical protein E1293_40905 [Actinomadura darangshiensis]
MRIGIAATGTVLLLAGASALALGLGAFDAFGALSGRPLLDPAVGRFTGDHAWFLPALAGAAELLALTGQLWLVVQGRAVVHHWWPDLDPETRGRARAAADVLNRDVRGLPGVQDVRVRLTGTANKPRLRLNVSCAGDTLLSEVYGELGAGPVERYRRATGMPDLPVVIRFRPVSERPRRRRRRPRPETA